MQRILVTTDNHDIYLYSCDECDTFMSSRAYKTYGEGRDASHLCWYCVGPLITPDYPKDSRQAYVSNAHVEEPRPKRSVREIEHYQLCQKHAVPCHEMHDPMSDFHEGGWETCCYYCCETCKDKCPDPVTQQRRVKVSA